MSSTGPEQSKAPMVTARSLLAKRKKKRADACSFLAM